MSEDQEEWRVVPGYGGAYEVSSKGRMRTVRPVYLKGHVSRSNDKALSVRVSIFDADHKPLTATIHSLIMAAFVGPRPKGMLIRHLDGNAENNSLNNLKYGTHRENSNDMAIHGTKLYAENHPRSKLTNEDVFRIRDMLCCGGDVRDIACRMGVSYGVISGIRRGKSWVGAVYA